VGRDDFSANQMIQTLTANFKSVPKRKPKADRKFLVGLLMVAIALAGFFYWRQFNPFRHGQEPATASRAVPTATVPVAAQPAPTASSPKIDSHPAVAKSEHQVAIKTAAVGFANSLMAVLSPSAKAEPVQKQMPAAPDPAAEIAGPAKQAPVQAAAVSSTFRDPPALTAGQKRLLVAQEGFGHVMDLAVQDPDAYGFLPDEDLGVATLGKEIPIYTIKLQGRRDFAKQPVSSVLKSADEWLYPIILENKIRYLVLVKYNGHDYVPGEGSRALAMTYDKILARWPASKGFHPQLITVPNLPSYYFTIPELPEQNITDTDRMFEFDPTLSPASIVLSNCR
jgi:hypothetical protein